MELLIKEMAHIIVFHIGNKIVLLYACSLTILYTITIIIVSVLYTMHVHKNLLIQLSTMILLHDYIHMYVHKRPSLSLNYLLCALRTLS